jgi:Secretion system C-terminal sorting domain/YHYH protein
MKTTITILILLITTHFASAHDSHRHGKLQHFSVGDMQIRGYFSMLKNNEVYIENEHHKMIHFPLAKFSASQQKIFIDKYATIEATNAPIIIPKLVESNIIPPYFLWLEIFSIGIFFIFGYQFYKSFSTTNKMKFVYPILMICVATLLMSAEKKVRSTTDPLQVDKAFIPFKPNVYTHWDATWYYVESKGIPTTHGMMVGIGSNGWQQQVPIPHCYTVANAWQIPLNPVLATTPVAVDANHFTKGAIAIAVNGVPIFNPYTNTGADAFLTGQLDNFGGHCGRGDDYHYHTAPTHLYASTNDTLPIAYSLDGYAVRGTKEHDGTAVASLDANHGHNYGGVYHYHGSAGAPYMIGNMVGVVTEDANKQIIPQPQGQPVRTENWTPLNGALITACTPNATNNGYTLSYTLNGTSGYGIDYSWSGTTYTFTYITPSGNTTKTYIGPNLSACNLPNEINTMVAFAKEISIYPNPATDILQINLGKNVIAKDVKQIAIVNMQGSIVYTSNIFSNRIDIKNIAKGNYFLMMKIGEKYFLKMISKQ